MLTVQGWQWYIPVSVPVVVVVLIVEDIGVLLVCNLLQSQDTNIQTDASRSMSGPLYPNAPSVLFCTFPRPASLTSNTYPIGCPSPTWVESIE